MESDICVFCNLPMVRNHKLQKYHTECGNIVNKERALKAYYDNNKCKTDAESVTMKNGVEILLNAFGREISDVSNSHRTEREHNG